MFSLCKSVGGPVATRYPYATDIITRPRKRNTTVVLPPTLSTAIAALLTPERTGLKRKELRGDAKALRQFLFSRKITTPVVHDEDSLQAINTTSGGGTAPKYRPGLKYGPREVVAYAAARYPVVYAAACRAIAELKSTLPFVESRTVLNFGSGLGTVPAAFEEIYGSCQHSNTSLPTTGDRRYLCVDSSPAMIEAAIALAEGHGRLKPSQLQHRQVLPDASPTPEYDIVVTAFTLSEIPQCKLRGKVLDTLWGHAKGALILIESGNAQGFSLIHEARERLELLSDCAIVAPCPHSARCPKVGTRRPCHFPVRVEVPRAQMLSGPELRDGTRSEKFSYIILARTSNFLQESKEFMGRSLLPRVVSGPVKRKGHILFDVCVAPDGMSTNESSDAFMKSSGTLERRIVSKSAGKEAWSCAKRVGWGDVLPPWKQHIGGAMPDTGKEIPVISTTKRSRKGASSSKNWAKTQAFKEGGFNDKPDYEYDLDLDYTENGSDYGYNE